MSDLHLEFYRPRPGMPTFPPWEPTPNDQDKDTVLLLAGDIHVGLGAVDWITKMCDRYKNVVYILGNHEFYHNEFKKVKREWKEKDMPDNFHFLDNDVVVIDDVRILGTTMWTLVTDPFARLRGQQGMSDYAVIKINQPSGIYRRLNVADTDKECIAATLFLEHALDKPFDGKTIVMTHHLPHPDCVAAQYQNHPLNPFYLNDLTELIEKYNIDVWCHGHTHDNVDIHVGKTRILCNPRGYHGVALNRDFNEDLTFGL